MTLLSSAFLPRTRRASGVVARQQELTAESLWTEVSDRLKGALNDTTYGTWFGDVSSRELTDEAFVLSVPNDFTREWIEGHFLDLIGAAVRDAGGTERKIRLSVEQEVEPAGPMQKDTAPQTRPAFDMSQKYTFDSFVIGSSNRFAHAAALAVAESPAQAYNPLFIYGGTGLGKTHLLQAVGQYVGEHSKKLSVRYITSEMFMNDFINSLRDKRIEGFKQRYRTYDLLLIDDIQFLEHKERIQEEFFHTFNSLYEAGRQIVISSDRPPREISTLEERLRSRFEWGLITDIQPPDLETRIAILRKKVKTDGIHVPDPQVLTFIAGRVVHEHPRARGGLDACRRLLEPHRAPDDRGARPGRPQGRVSTRRSARSLDRAHSNCGLRPVRALDGGALRRPTLAEHRVPKAGRDVPVARADRCVTPEDRA